MEAPQAARRGVFITFEGTEGCGKTTQIARLDGRLKAAGYRVCCVREPGGTPIGEEIRHTLQHSQANHAMTAEAELLLMNASRAQLVREVIRPALAAGSVVLCDRFYDSTLAYQGYGRELPLDLVQSVIDVAVGPTKPDLTVLLQIPLELSEERRASRQGNGTRIRDRMEEADRRFFERVERGFLALAANDAKRIHPVDGRGGLESVSESIWRITQTILPQPDAPPR